MFFIDNDNIHKDEHLNKSGLNLNATGNSIWLVILLVSLNVDLQTNK